MDKIKQYKTTARKKNILDVIHSDLPLAQVHDMHPVSILYRLVHFELMS